MTPTVSTISRRSTAGNLWSARRIADWLAQQPVEKLTQPVPSSFKTIADTLYHIQMVEHRWLYALQGEEIAIPYGQPYTGTIPDLLAAFVTTAEQLDEYVQTLSETDLEEPCAFKIPIRWREFTEFEQPRFLVIQHAVIHAAYHRGQLVTMGHSLGLSKAPMTDFITSLIMPS